MEIKQVIVKKQAVNTVMMAVHIAFIFTELQANWKHYGKYSTTISSITVCFKENKNE
jgi:hypothetical protein